MGKGSAGCVAMPPILRMLGIWYKPNRHQNEKIPLLGRLDRRSNADPGGSPKGGMLGKENGMESPRNPAGPNLAQIRASEKICFGFFQAQSPRHALIRTTTPPAATAAMIPRMIHLPRPWRCMAS